MKLLFLVLPNSKVDHPPSLEPGFLKHFIRTRQSSQVASPCIHESKICRKNYWIFLILFSVWLLWMNWNGLAKCLKDPTLGPKLRHSRAFSAWCCYGPLFFHFMLVMQRRANQKGQRFISTKFFPPIFFLPFSVRWRSVGKWFWKGGRNEKSRDFELEQTPP